MLRPKSSDGNGSSTDKIFRDSYKNYRLNREKIAPDVELRNERGKCSYRAKVFYLEANGMIIFVIAKMDPMIRAL